MALSVGLLLKELVKRMKHGNTFRPKKQSKVKTLFSNFGDKGKSAQFSPSTVFCITGENFLPAFFK